MHDLFYREDVFQDYDHGDKRRRGVDFTIDYQGRWYFHGLQSPGPIKRKALAGLFGGAGDGFMAGKGLFRDEAGAYWLKSPDGHYRVEVEDVPFIITHYDIHNPGPGQAIILQTQFDEIVRLDSLSCVELRPEPRHNIPVLYVEVRGGLWARFSTQIQQSFARDVLKDDGECYRFTSAGHEFTLRAPS